jgi:hypothetical protein
MTVNFEIKGMLARLLATEDLVVEHKKVDTACFNVKTRVLTLPLWERASNTVYDMLVAHEVSHALYTPNEDLTSFGVPHQFINVVEDARVEKLIKRRYMGLSKTFYTAYGELNDDDFFCIKDEDVSEMNLADRANLYFKVGHFIDVQFNSKEQEIIDDIASTETFDEVIIAAKKLYEYCKDYQDKPESIDAMFPNVNNETSGSGSQEQSEDINNDVDEDFSEGEPTESSRPDDSGNSNSQTGNSMSPIGNKEEEPKVNTMDSLQKSIENLASFSVGDNIYVEIPSLNLDTVIADNKQIHDHICEHFDKCKSVYQGNRSNFDPADIFENVDQEYVKFKKSSQKEVNYLVKEFECRKSADSYARATVSKTGVLDCGKLHTYKFNDDIFRKVTTLSDGKNHGLIFVLDWSGSMNEVMPDTIKQLYNLIWFCKKVSIPFEVYAFTGEWCRYDRDENNKPIVHKPHYEKKEGLFAVDERFTMMNLLTSKVSNSVMNEQMANIWRVAKSFKGYYGFSTPDRLTLSGTPLNESIISLYNIIPDFQKKNKLQKVQCVILTDGEANQLAYHSEYKRSMNSTETYIGNRRIVPNSTFIRDRKLGTTYKIGETYVDFTTTIISNLRDRFPEVNFIGIRILSGRDVSHFIRLYCGSNTKDYENASNSWKKDRSFAIKCTSYSAYFGISSNNLSQDTQFNLNIQNPTKNQIKSAFVKSLNNKKLNKKILGEFIELIA